MVMLLEGRHLQFFIHKKLDPSSFVLFYNGVILLWHYCHHDYPENEKASHDIYFSNDI